MKIAAEAFYVGTNWGRTTVNALQIGMYAENSPVFKLKVIFFDTKNAVEEKCKRWCCTKLPIPQWVTPIFYTGKQVNYVQINLKLQLRLKN